MQEHDQVLNALQSQVDASHLSSRINQWEQESIAKIKDTAEQARADLQALLDRTKHQLVGSLGKISEELRSRQASNAYAEKELTEWLTQLERLRQTLKNPTDIDIVEDDAVQLSLRKIRVVEKMHPEASIVPNQTAPPTKASSATFPASKCISELVLVKKNRTKLAKK